MQTLNIELPATLSVDFRDEVGTKAVNLADKSQDWILWAISNGLRQSVADAIAGKAGTDEGKKAILAKYERVCVEGQIPSGGGGGPRMSIEDAGMVAFFNSKGSPVKFTKTTCNKKNLDQYIRAFVQKAIWPSVAKAIANLDKNVQVAFHKDKLPQLVKDNTEKVLAIAQKDPKGMGAFIDAERKKREGIKETSFAVEIEITM